MATVFLCTIAAPNIPTTPIEDLLSSVKIGTPPYHQSISLVLIVMLILVSVQATARVAPLTATPSGPVSQSLGNHEDRCQFCGHRCECIDCSNGCSDFSRTNSLAPSVANQALELVGGESQPSPKPMLSEWVTPPPLHPPKN